MGNTIHALRAVCVSRKAPGGAPGAVASDAVETCLLRGAILDVPVCAVSTCERFEVYALGDVEALVNRPDVCAHDRYTGEHAAAHLFRVAAGLDSRLVGEPHILGQVRRAADLAESVGVLGSVLRGVFDRAIRCGKRARSESGLDRVTTGYADRAAARASAFLDGSRGDAIVIGTGAIAREVVAGLAADHQRRIVVAGRHAERTACFGETFGVRTTALDRLPDAMRAAAAVIAATSSPRTLVHARDVPAERRPLLIDLGMPGNIEASIAGRVGLDELAAGSCPAAPIVGHAEQIVRAHVERLVRRERRSEGVRSTERVR